MPSTTYAETLFFKKLKHPSNKSNQMGLLFFNNIPVSQWVQPLVCNKMTPTVHLHPFHPWSNIQVKADLNFWYLDDGCIGGHPLDSCVGLNCLTAPAPHPQNLNLPCTHRNLRNLACSRTCTLLTRSHPNLPRTVFFLS